MKKLVFSLMVLFLTSENIARGSFFQLGLGYDHLNTYELWAPNMIHNIKSNHNFKININLRILTINKTMKIFLELSTGLSLKSLLLPNKDLAEYIEREEPLIYNLNKTTNILYINLPRNNNSAPRNIFISSIKPGKEKNSYIISYKDFDNERWDSAKVKINDLFKKEKNNNNNTFVYPNGITCLHIPISAGLSTKIKIRSKTYLKIGLYLYKNSSTMALYNYSVLINLFLKSIDAENETSSLNQINEHDLNDNMFHKNIDALRSFFLNNGQNLFELIQQSKDFIKFLLDLFPILVFALDIVLGGHPRVIPDWYGGIFNITICSKIYKHLEISILLISLECCCITKKDLNEDFHPFNGNPFVLFLHLPSISISVLV